MRRVQSVYLSALAGEMLWREHDALTEFILDRIDAWHEADTGVGLPEWLGWTWDEYAAWAEGRVA